MQSRLDQQDLIKTHNLALTITQNDILTTAVNQAANLLQINFTDQVQAQYFVDRALIKLERE